MTTIGRHRRVLVALLALALLQTCLLASCTRPSPIVAEIESPDWKYAVETEHYVISTNISRDLVERAAVVAERAYTAAVKRLRADDDDPAFVKTAERTFDRMPWKLTYTWDDGTKLYETPDGLKMTEWPRENTVRSIEFSDGRSYAFWEWARYGRKATIYLCATKKELDAWFADGNDAGRGGWGPATGVVGIMAVSKNPNYDLDNIAHEIGHQVLGYCVYGPPVWLDEGLAMYAGIDHTSGEYRAGLIRPAMLKTCAESAEKGALVPVDKLVSMDFGAFHIKTDDEWLHYAQSWALVHCLMQSKHPQIRGKLPGYINELKKGRDALEALKATYDLDLLQQEYVEYIKALWRANAPQDKLQAAAEPEPLLGRGWRLAAA